MPTAAVILLLALILLLVTLLVGRSRLSSAYTRMRGRFKRKPTDTGIAVIDKDGAAYPIPAAPNARPRRRDRIFALARQRDRFRALARRLEWRQAIRRSERLLASLAIILIGLIALWQLPNLLPSRLDRFTVLVAPFNERDGSVTQTGRAVADGLTAELGNNRQIRAVRIPDPPADLTTALALMDRENADALVWGTIAPGGMLDQESLTPILAYRPTGAFAPFGWEGYSGRFAMPTFYTVSDAPINGQVVLPDLLGALADYGAGRVDGAFTELGALAENTPTLLPALPSALRGNILWARGEYEQAAGEYRRALGSTNATGQPQAARLPGAPLPDPRPLLTNNLGAIQQDAGDPAADKTFDQAGGLLKGRERGALRYNQGIADLRAGKYDAAIAALEEARQLLPAATPLLLTLSEAYRMDSRFPPAHEALNAAAQEVRADTQAPTSDLRDMTGNRLSAALAEQRALLDLAEFLQAKGSLLWELQASDRLDPRELGKVRDDLAQSVRETDALAQSWSRRAATEDASEHPIGGLLAINQFRRAEALLRERRHWQAAVNIEIARAQGVEPPHGLAAFWNSLVGDRSPLGQSREDLKKLLDTQPNDVEAAALYGEALLLSGDSAHAAEWFDKAAAAAPKRPEPAYGQALVAEAGGNHPRARDLLTKAIGLDERYFPARRKLAQIAEADAEAAQGAEAAKAWAVAVEQRRWLAQRRPSFIHTLELASALRRSGKAGYAEAERALLSLVNAPTLTDADTVPALVELGRLYYDNQDWDAARAVLERAQRAAPRAPNVAYELGRVLDAQGDTEAAAAQFRRAVENDPQPVAAHLALAKFYTQRANALAGQYAAESQIGANRPTLKDIARVYVDNINAASEQYRAALAANPNDPKQLKEIGDQLLASGEYQPAAGAYERLVKITPDDPVAHHGLARAYLRLGRLDAAETEEQKALALNNGPYPEAQAGLGDIALGRGKPDEAVEQYNTALRQNQRLASAYIGLGRAAAAAGNWAVAAAHFQRAIANGSGSAEAHFWLGEALLQQRDINAAIAEYKQAIGIKRDYAEAYYGLARAQMEGHQPKDIEDARATLEAALVLRPNYADALLAQGKLYEQQGLDDRAIESYGKAIDANAKLAEARYRRALLFIRQERMSEAERDLAAATGAQPNFPEAHYWLGRVYLAQDRPAAARDEFKTAITQRDGNYPDARFYQGIAEEQLGQRDEAAASFKAALDQAGDSAWAGDARAALARLGQP